MSDLYRYRVKGRSLTIPGRIIRLTVTAANADDARAMAKIKVPDFGTTVESPRRLAKLEPPDEPEQRTCRYHPDGCYVLPEPPDPIDEAKREYARWRDTDVEVV